MEETLTDCLVRVREDLSQLKKVREYLETNAETREPCSVTWRTIEAFNSILSVCSSLSSPETPALDTLLDSFFYLARCNTDNTVWDDFGFELGIICVKVLSAIERSTIFEVLFFKLLSIINVISEHNANIWKATGRQILNVLINKKITFSNLESILKLYVSILKHIDNESLLEFSSQNFHLLKTLSLLIQKIGDFELQYGIAEVIYLHLSIDRKLILDIFDNKNFIDFENDIRLYLNSLNKSRRGCDRKVYSICCHVLYLSGCFVEPPIGKNFIWVDANKDTERVSIKTCDSETEDDRVMLVPFSKILSVEFEKEKTEGNLCFTIKTKNLKLRKDVSGDICLVTENDEGVHEFVQFLEREVSFGKKSKKTSKTVESLVIDRRTPKKEVQNDAVTSSERPGMNQTLPDMLSLFQKGNPSMAAPTASQELSPNSFVESLNKHIGMDSPDADQNHEDSVETIDFLQKSNTGRNHKLFRYCDKIFDISGAKDADINFVWAEDKEKQSPGPKIKTYTQEQTERQVEINSQECFRGSSVRKKKPFLPKFKRSAKRSKVNEPEKNLDEEKENQKPSLLDPNGYAYQRWCKPTTSERSNFWLKKLSTLQKPKKTENVFDFSEESDSIVVKTKKRRVVHSKRRCRTKKETKQISIKEVREILKKGSPIREKEAPEKTPRKWEEAPGIRNGDREYGTLPIGEVEEPPENKKRDRSEEGSFRFKKKKKKTKIILPKHFLPIFRHRLEEVEEKDKRYTSEIIRTVDKATNHLFNYLQKKDGLLLISYLKTVEDISTSFETELEDLRLRTNRIQRAFLYFKAGCSVVNICKFLDFNFSNVREELRNLKEQKVSQNTVERVCKRLSVLIGTEVEKSFEAEWTQKRDRLLKCASMLGSN